MNKLLASALLLANASAKQAQDTQQMVLIVEGILKGALDAEGFDDIEHCIQDAATVIKDAEIAVQDFEKKDVQDVIAGIKEVGVILQTIKAGMSDCSHLKADWQRLAAMASIFSSPTSFAYHVGKDLLVNGKDIFREVEDSIVQYNSG